MIASMNRSGFLVRDPGHKQSRGSVRSRTDEAATRPDIFAPSLCRSGSPFGRNGGPVHACIILVRYELSRFYMLCHLT